MLSPPFDSELVSCSVPEQYDFGDELLWGCPSSLVDDSVAEIRPGDWLPLPPEPYAADLEVYGAAWLGSPLTALQPLCHQREQRRGDPIEDQ
jgi:hypothetical protein